MNTLTASEARANLYRLIDQTVESHDPSLFPANAIVPCCCLRKTGAQFKKPCTCWPFRACANPSRPAWPSLCQPARRHLSGELGNCLRQASSEGCEKACRKRPQTEGAGTAGNPCRLTRFRIHRPSKNWLATWRGRTPGASTFSTAWSTKFLQKNKRFASSACGPTTSSAKARSPSTTASSDTMGSAEQRNHQQHGQHEGHALPERHRMPVDQRRPGLVEKGLVRVVQVEDEFRDFLVALERGRDARPWRWHRPPRPGFRGLR